MLDRLLQVTYSQVCVLNHWLHFFRGNVCRILDLLRKLYEFEEMGDAEVVVDDAHHLIVFIR